MSILEELQTIALTLCQSQINEDLID